MSCHVVCVAVDMSNLKKECCLFWHADAGVGEEERSGRHVRRSMAWHGMTVFQCTGGWVWKGFSYVLLTVPRRGVLFSIAGGGVKQMRPVVLRSA